MLSPSPTYSWTGLSQLRNKSTNMFSIMSVVDTNIYFYQQSSLYTFWKHQTGAGRTNMKKKRKALFCPELLSWPGCWPKRARYESAAFTSISAPSQQFWFQSGRSDSVASSDPIRSMVGYGTVQYAQIVRHVQYVQSVPYVQIARNVQYVQYVQHG